ncbi:hypothetical protein G7Y89_g12245 [Cudoniella acicularis]|uniref:Heterokaryon incompatibility domain-containing protein n=1 Tax=Cudoniella acicularis TaxID=354080 RepID=A0A8H4VZU8_9HELO|nr:hypothetical protein G7Y89_g12245 [Cudoniella acicularis]
MGFQYQPLNPNEIRLLKPLSRSSNSLSFEIVQTSLLLKPRYAALSYTWGAPYRNIQEKETECPPEFTKSITCNGMHVAVAQNLFNALAALTQVNVAELLWADALCINQADEFERPSQVLMMGEIYSSAEEVLGWLGPLHRCINDLVWGTTSLVSALEANKSSLYIRLLRDPKFWAKIGMVDSSDRLSRIGWFWKSCRWFSRAWVIQEVVLAQNLRLFCGDIELSFDRLSMLSNSIRRLGWQTQIKIDPNNNNVTGPLLQELSVWQSIKDSPFCGSAQKAFLKGRWKENSEFVWWLSEVLQSCRRSACQNVHDKVYSILGVVAHSFPGISISEYISPNYNIPINELFTHVTKLILMHSLTLSYVSDTRRTSSDSRKLNIPSWVIDYSCAEQTVDICKINPGLDTSAAIRCQFPGFSFTQTTLRCYGAQFDTVDEVQRGTLADAAQSETGFRNLLRFYLSIPLEIRGRRRMELFWRTLIVNTHDTYDPGNAPILFENNFKAWFTLKISFGRHKASLRMDHHVDFSELTNLLDTMGAPDEKIILEDVEKLCDWYSSAEQGLKPFSNDGQFLRKVRKMQDAYTTFSTPFCYLSHGRKVFRTEKGMLVIREEVILYAKRNPSENRGQNLKFPRCFVQYQSTYEQRASTQSWNEQDLQSRNVFCQYLPTCLSGDERLTVTGSQVIERHIVRGIERIFSPVVVNGLADSEAEAIAMEPAATRRQRRFLEERTAKLGDGGWVTVTMKDTDDCYTTEIDESAEPVQRNCDTAELDEFGEAIRKCRAPGSLIWVPGQETGFSYYLLAPPNLVDFMTWRWSTESTSDHERVYLRTSHPAPGTTSASDQDV